MTAKKYRKIKIALSVLLALFLFLFGVASGLLIASADADRNVRFLPAYQKEDLAPLAAKESWTDEDYRTILMQTGLGRSAADALRAEGNAAALSLYQDEFFYEGEVRHEFTAGTVTTLHDVLYEPGTDTEHHALFAPLEKGDVILTSTCHTFGWHNGHAVLVTDVRAQDVLESTAPGQKSRITHGGARWFAASPNFLVLRLKGVSKEERAELADRAKTELVGVGYTLTVGIFSPKDQCENGRAPQGTNCAHLVWQSYKNCGYDIDSNGGLVVTVHNIAKSDLFEVVQAYGFDPDRLWR